MWQELFHERIHPFVVAIRCHCFIISSTSVFLSINKKWQRISAGFTTYDFTVNLVVYENVDLPTLKLLRGDKSNEAAETYLRNKGLLRNKLTETVAQLFDQIISEDETE